VGSEPAAMVILTDLSELAALWVAAGLLSRSVARRLAQRWYGTTL
jgi:hypothetical protein